MPPAAALPDHFAAIFGPGVFGVCGFCVFFFFFFLRPEHAQWSRPRLPRDSRSSGPAVSARRSSLCVGVRGRSLHLGWPRARAFPRASQLARSAALPSAAFT